MPSAKSSIPLLLVGLLASFAGAQIISNSFAPVVGFVDISTTGGTAIVGVTDDSTHGIVTTLGNSFFPAGAVTVANNGSASALAGALGPYINNDIPAGAALPAGLSLGALGILCPFWDDLYPPVQPSATTLYWQESGGVLYIMWKDDNHYADATVGNGITFEIQVFDGAAGPCTPKIQFLYSDTVFGGVNGPTCDNGLSATIGYVKASNAAAASNAKWSYLTSSVGAGACLTITEGVGGLFTLTAQSPGGAGSGTLQLDFTNGFTCFGGTYVLAATLNPGFPGGWLYGVPIPVTELNVELTTGFPFIGPLFPNGTFTLGPFSGLPIGLTFAAVGLGIPATGPAVPTIHTTGISFTIP